jgi:hypothetical protein
MIAETDTNVQSFENCFLTQRVDVWFVHFNVGAPDSHEHISL